MEKQLEGKQYLLTGGYNQKNGGGICSWLWNREMEELALCCVEETCENPSYLALHPDRHIIYAANEVEGAAKITAHRFCHDTGKIEFINAVTTRGADMCHLIINNSRTAVYGGNYTSGNIVAFQLKEDGSLGEEISNIQHQGAGIHSRQEGPHVHQLLFDEDGSHLIAVDFGLDALFTYSLDEQGRILAETCVKSSLPSGEGPRHMVFQDRHYDQENEYYQDSIYDQNNSYDQDNSYYLITELGNKVFHLNYNKDTGAFTCLDSLPLLDLQEIKAENTGAEILISPESGLIYTSVRGVDEIISVKTGQKEPQMEISGRFKSFGRMPRMFSFSADGSYMFIANQQSGNVAVVRMCGEEGTLCRKISVPDVSFVIQV